MASSLIGRTLGNYKIIEQLGQGGMATVYLGYQEAVDRRVAIKVLPPHPGMDTQFAERFPIEARTIANLQHPHILPLYDYGSHEDILYLVMRYVDGGSLESLLSDGPMPLRQIERILHEIAGALDYAHRNRVIHRDIKPGNILIDSEGHALLADFGIAKLTENAANLTGTSVVGTPAYMAPEQAQGTDIDPRVDIYSMGVVVYQMVTGKLPFTGPTLMQVMLKVMQDPAPNILDTVPELPPAVGEVMNRVLAKEPDDRYQTTTEFADDFSLAIQSEGQSLAEIREAAHLEPRTRSFSQVATPIKMRSASAAEAITGILPETIAQPGTQTVIVHQSTNPLILLAGFGIIAVMLVAVVLIIVSNLNKDENTLSDDDISKTQIAAQATQDSSEQIVFTPVPQAPTFGQVSYSSNNSFGDALSVRVENLTQPPAGQVYVAWLLDTANAETIRLGEIAVDPLGNGSLAYTDSEGLLLPAYYNAIALSLEPRANIGETPTGEVVYSGVIPTAVPRALYEIFISSPDGLPLNSGETSSDGYEAPADSGTPVSANVETTSLLDGALAEAQVAAQHSGLAANASSLGGMQTHAEHTVNILKGETVDYDGDGRGVNPGRGVGVYAFSDLMRTKLTDAINSSQATRNLQVNAEFILVCLQNTNMRADRMVELETLLIEADTQEAVSSQAQESTQIADELQNGFDLNNNGIIEAFEGECGLEQIKTFGILVGALDIVEGGLPE